MDQEILLALGRLEGKVDSLLTQQSITNEELNKHDSRIRDLEMSRSWLMGAAGAISLAVSVLVSMIKW